MMKRKSTMVELVKELEKLPRSNYLDLIIAEAKAGEYHDFKNKKYECGKLALVHKLFELGLTEIRQDVIDGVYDEDADEDDLEMLVKDLFTDPRR